MLMNTNKYFAELDAQEALELNGGAILEFKTRTVTQGSTIYYYLDTYLLGKRIDTALLFKIGR